MLRYIVASLSLLLAGCNTHGQIQSASYMVEGEDAHFLIYLSQEEVNKISEGEYHVFLFVYRCDRMEKLLTVGLDYGKAFLGESKDIRVIRGKPFVGIQKISDSFREAPSICLQLKGGSYFSGQYQSDVVVAKEIGM